MSLQSLTRLPKWSWVGLVVLSLILGAWWWVLGLLGPTVEVTL